jgi:hypothetical protein
VLVGGHGSEVRGVGVAGRGCGEKEGEEIRRQGLRTAGYITARVGIHTGGASGFQFLARASADPICGPSLAVPHNAVRMGLTRPTA